TFLLTAVVAISALIFGPPRAVGWLACAGLGFLTVHSAVVCATYPRLTPRWRMVVPLVTLGALVAIGAEVLPVLPMSTFVGVIPLLWLIFEFGRRGLILAVASL